MGLLAESWTEPLVSSAVVGVALLAGGLAVDWVSTRAADGRLGRNGVAGIRTRATRASDDAWLQAHRAGLPASRWGARVLVVTAIVSLLPGPAMAVTGWGSVTGFRAWWVAVLAVGLVVGVGLVVLGALAGQRVALDLARQGGGAGTQG